MAMDVHSATTDSNLLTLRLQEHHPQASLPLNLNLALPCSFPLFPFLPTLYRPFLPTLFQRGGLDPARMFPLLLLPLPPFLP